MGKYLEWLPGPGEAITHECDNIYKLFVCHIDCIYVSENMSYEYNDDIIGVFLRASLANTYDLFYLTEHKRYLMPMNCGPLLSRYLYRFFFKLNSI